MGIIVLSLLELRNFLARDFEEIIVQIPGREPLSMSPNPLISLSKIAWMVQNPSQGKEGELESAIRNVQLMEDPGKNLLVNYSGNMPLDAADAAYGAKYTAIVKETDGGAKETLYAA